MNNSYYDSVSYHQEYNYNFNEQNYYEPTNRIRKIYSVHDRRDARDVNKDTNNEEWSIFNQRVIENPELKGIFESAKKEGELEALKGMHTRLRNLGIGTTEVEKQMRKTVMNNILKSNDIEAKRRGKYEQKRDI